MTTVPSEKCVQGTYSVTASAAAYFHLSVTSYTKHDDNSDARSSSSETALETMPMTSPRGSTISKSLFSGHFLSTVHRSRSQGRVIFRPMDLSNISIRRVFGEGLVPLSEHQAPTADSLSKSPFLAFFLIHRTRPLPRCRG